MTGLTLFDGKTEMPGQIYEKDEVLKIYREIVAKLKDPALLEYAGQNTYRARVFPVPARSRQNLELNFDYLLPKKRRPVEFQFSSGRSHDQGT